MTQSPLRKLSMRLASLCEDDRQWIMAQLGADERHTVSGLLAEIEELGLLQEPALVRAILAEPMPATIGNTAVDQTIIAKLSSSAHPAWAALYLQGLTQETRSQVVKSLPPDQQSVLQWQEKLSSASVPPALLGALHKLASNKGSGL
jgi:hypothetical protein